MSAEHLPPDPDRAEYDLLGRVYDRADLAKIPKPEPVIDAWVDKGAAVLVGDTGTNKTFILVGWGCSISTGVPWLGHDVKIEPSPVMLFVGEGGGGLDSRVAAWEAEHDIKIPHERLWTLLLPESIDNGEFWEQATGFAKEVGARFVAFDTFSSLAPNADETKEAAPTIRRMTDLASAIDGTVVMAHHTGWTKKTRARGGSQWHANPDAVLLCEGVDDGELNAPVRIARLKVKDGEAGHEIHVRRKYLAEADSCVLELTGAPAGDTKQIAAEAERRSHIREALASAKPFTLTRSELAAKAGRNKQAMLATVDAMIRSGEIPTRNAERRDKAGRRQQCEVLGHVEAGKLWVAREAEEA
jgi:AAA domain